LGCAASDPAAMAMVPAMPMWIWCALLAGIARPTTIGPAVLSIVFHRSAAWAIAVAALLAAGLVNLP